MQFLGKKKNLHSTIGSTIQSLPPPNAPTVESPQQIKQFNGKLANNKLQFKQLKNQ